jgi:hypothetical protein
MLIKATRKGFANNSSSTHSIIFVKTEDLKKIMDDNNPYEFGWNYFTCVNLKSKEQYLFTNLICDLSNINEIPYFANLTYDENKILEKKYVNLILKRIKPKFNFFRYWDEFVEAYNEDSHMYVDHQSVISLPIGRCGTINFDFYSDLCMELLKPNYVILGGNDNDDDVHKYAHYDRGLSKIVSLCTSNQPY